MISVPDPILETLSASYGTARADLSYLGGGGESSDGIAYSYTQGGQERVLKVMAMPAGDEDSIFRFQERLRFIHFLGEAGVSIVYPRPGKTGSLFALAPEGKLVFIAYSMDRISGSPPRVEDWTDAFFTEWGRTVGRLHCITQQYPTWQHSVNPETGKTVLGWEEEWQGFYDMCEDEQVKNCWAAMRERLRKLPVHRGCFGFVHNDPHHQNILMDGDRIVLLDFDVANYHWFATDISIAAQSILFTQTGGMERPMIDPGPLRRFLDFFMQGYRMENELDNFWLTQLDLFISYRRMLLFTVLQNWLNTKPDVRESWKAMILAEPKLVEQ